MAADGSFDTFGMAHLGVMLLTLLLCIFLPLLVRKLKDPLLTKYIAWSMVVVMVGNEIVWYVWGLQKFEMLYFFRHFLPYQVCGMGLFLVMIALVTRKQLVYEIAYYWGLGGTIQALLTPNIDEGFPEFQFFRFFICHSGMVIAVAYMTWGMKMRPRFRSIFITIGFTLAFSALTGLVNWLIGANYMFLCNAPPGDSPFFFLPWPWYLFIIFPLGIVFIFILYAIHPITEFIQRKLGLDENESEPDRPDSDD